VKSTIESIGPGEAIEDGDIFICNDPYLGAIHHPDIATVGPVFFKGKLAA
jgi:N-methylhydantoinase B